MSFAVFLPALDAEFLNWDDDQNLVDNPHYRGLSWSHVRWMFTTTLLGHYTPLTWLTHGVDYLLWGMRPWGYHLVNLVVHALTAGVFYFVARRLLAAGFEDSLGGRAQTDPTPALSAGAAFAAIVFGVHPLRVESVAWVTERQDVLCGLFYLLAALTYLRGLDAGGAIERRWWALSVAAFLLALLSKAAAMPLPAALLLLDVYPHRRVAAVGWRRLLIEKVPYLVLAAATAPVALIAQSHANALVDMAKYGIGPRLVMMAYSLMFYPWKFFWAANLSPFYEVPRTIDPLAPRFALPMVGLVVVTAALVALRRRLPALLAAWVYSALLVLPVSGAAQIGAHLVADRFSYLSGFGFALLVGATLVWLVQSRGMLKPSVFGASLLAVVLVVAGLAAGAWRLSKVWHDSETLWRFTLDLDPNCVVCRINLGGELIALPAPDASRAREAETLFRRALALHPDLGMPYRGLGIALARQRRDQEAEAAFVEYMNRVPFAPAGPVELAHLYATQGRYSDAIPLLQRAFAMEPGFPGLTTSLARALRARGEELLREGQPRAGDALLKDAAAIERKVPASARQPDQPSGR